MPDPLRFPTPRTHKIRRQLAQAKTVAAVRSIALAMVREIELAGAKRRSCRCCWRNVIN